MKKLLCISSICAALFLISSCDNNNSKTDTHIHEDGATHQDHDTGKPIQQEFNVIDSVKPDSSIHIHKNGENHSH